MATRQLSDLPYEQQHLVLELSGRLASKFAGVFRPETVERFVVDSWDQLQTTTKTTAMLPLLTERFARERLQALATVEGSLPSLVPGVLFLCVQNVGRSQMAAGWMRRLAGDRVVVYSGGSEPASEISAAVIEAMDEVGIDIRQNSRSPGPKRLCAPFDVVITMGCGDVCRPYPGKPYEDSGALRSCRARH